MYGIGNYAKSKDGVLLFAWEQHVYFTQAMRNAEGDGDSRSYHRCVGRLAAYAEILELLAGIRVTDSNQLRLEKIIAALPAGTVGRDQLQTELGYLIE